MASSGNGEASILPSNTTSLYKALYGGMAVNERGSKIGAEEFAFHSVLHTPLHAPDLAFCSYNANRMWLSLLALTFGRLVQESFISIVDSLPRPVKDPPP